MSTRPCLSALFLVLSSACGDTRSAAPPGIDAGSDAPKPTPDAKAPHDAASDTRAADTGRDVGVDAPISHEASTGHDATADAGRDAPPADAGHDAGLTCDVTGAAPGTIGKAVALESGKITDFDIDCQGIVYVDSTGAVSACPATGCVAAPTVIAPSLSAQAARIVPSGLIVFADPVPDGGGRPLFDIFSQVRAPAGASHLLYSLTLVGSDSAKTPGVAGPDPYYFYTEIGGGGGGTSLQVLAVASDGGAPAVASYSAGGAGGAEDLACATTIDGTDYYAACTLSTSTSHTSAITRTNVVGAAEGGTQFFVPPAPVSFGAIAASDAFVVWRMTPSSDAGTGGIFACAAGGTCAGPTTVTGIDTWTFAGTHHDTLFLTDGSGKLGTCHVADLLAGSCTPTVLATGLAAWSRLVADDANVYLLLTDGSAVLRIAR